MSLPIELTRFFSLRVRMQAHRSNGMYWPWLANAMPSKRDANKFLFGCILNYQMPVDKLWSRCANFLEVVLQDPLNLWDTVAATPLDEWLARTGAAGLHRFKKLAHARVWRIGCRIVTEYGGDARNIWAGCTTAEAAARLDRLGVGPNLSRMTAGALFDVGITKGSSDVKADVHVCRVLGRVVTGQSLPPDEAVNIARMAYPANPWLLDSILFEAGKLHCRPVAPVCGRCVFHPVCAYVRK